MLGTPVVKRRKQVKTAIPGVVPGVASQKVEEAPERTATFRETR